MSSFERKLRRKQTLKGQRRAEEEMATKVALFGKLGDKCLTCEKDFDKLNREQVMSWRVAIRQQEDKVNLYCPDCWQKATQLVQQYQKDRREKK